MAKGLDWSVLWRSQDEFGKVMAFLTKIGKLEVNKDLNLCRRNPHSVFE